MITAADNADLNAQGGLSANKLIHKEGYREIMLLKKRRRVVDNHCPLHCSLSVFDGWDGEGRGGSSSPC